MSSLITLLGIIAILLTAVGSYRFSAYFLGQGIISALIATGATVSFVILFPYIALVTGIAVLLTPVVVVLKSTDRIYLPIVNVNKENTANKGDGPGTGKLDAYPNYKPLKCPNPDCSRTYNRDDDKPKFCVDCGTAIGDSK